MKQAESQQWRAHNQAAAQKKSTAGIESPQGGQIAQLEAMIASSPQAGKLTQLVAVANGGPQAAKLAQLAAMMNGSPRAAAQRKLVDGINNSPRMAAQRRNIESLFGGAAQRQETEETVQTQPETAQKKPNNTGLPDNLKSGIENLSGLSMDNVKVHYNSPQPAQLNAHAYAQGTDIHVAPGQEQHLPHEAWHVVQQAQGRVRPTMQMKESVPVNDDRELEQEADVMGAKAVQMSDSKRDSRPAPHLQGEPRSAQRKYPDGEKLQLKKDEEERGEKHRRVENARETIAALGNNVKAGLEGHVFEAKPIGGGNLQPANPTGLHAYTDGALPAGVTMVARQGSPGRVHTLTWRTTAGNVTKDSTMFPVWMPKEHVNTLMALKYQEVRAQAVDNGLIHPDATKTYIQHGQNIYDNLTKAGDTVYPQ